VGDPNLFSQRLYIHRIIENFINLNNISKEGLHSIKHERDRIDLFFHHQGKLNVDFGDAIIKTHLSDYYLYPTCLENVLDRIVCNNFSDKNSNSAITQIGHFLNNREANQNFKDWVVEKRMESYSEWMTALRADIPDLFKSELASLFIN
jgi:hypothetical protein